MASRFRIQPLGRDHDRAAFSCDEEPLDLYLKHQARQDVERSLAAVFVLLDPQADRIAGYYSLSALSIDSNDLPPDIHRKLPRYPIPVTLIGRLAIDTDYQGQRLGTALLFDALKRAHGQRTQIGAMAVVVNAKHAKARAFYEHHEFRRFSVNEFRLFLTMKSIGMLLDGDM